MNKKVLFLLIKKKKEWTGTWRCLDNFSSEKHRSHEQKKVGIRHDRLRVLGKVTPVLGGF